MTEKYTGRRKTDVDISEERIKWGAEHAADFDLGTHANPFPEDSVLHGRWNNIYYARLLETTTEALS